MGQKDVVYLTALILCLNLEEALRHAAEIMNFLESFYRHTYLQGLEKDIQVFVLRLPIYVYNESPFISFMANVQVEAAKKMQIASYIGSGRLFSPHNACRNVFLGLGSCHRQSCLPISHTCRDKVLIACERVYSNTALQTD